MTLRYWMVYRNVRRNEASDALECPSYVIAQSLRFINYWHDFFARRILLSWSAFHCKWNIRQTFFLQSSVCTCKILFDLLIFITLWSHFLLGRGTCFSTELLIKAQESGLFHFVFYWEEGWSALKALHCTAYMAGELKYFPFNIHTVIRRLCIIFQISVLPTTYHFPSQVNRCWLNYVQIVVFKDSSLLLKWLAFQ